ncbi:TPA: hypothetical protein ACNOH7_000457 [Vibrio fluvialis]|nr:hypothetical protein [Vibrio fluvialis]ELL9331486.1 hypothetical protein [Vibrio fluvialis]MBY8218914.1 hypothetical protein [Vibrio fluvialis]
MNKPSIVNYFAYQHLPEKLQVVSKPFHDIVNKMVVELPENEESHMALRKLLEAKDCAVRAMVGKS